MMKFTILVIASVLAPGFAAIVQTRPVVDIATLPGVLELEPEPVLRPQPIPEVEAVVPEIIDINPCNACFEYMTELINQLTEVPEAESEDIPEVVRPLPESLPEDLRPLPVPEQPEVEVNPIPIPVAPEVDIRPLPLPVAPEVEIQPIPLPVVSLIRPAF